MGALSGFSAFNGFSAPWSGTIDQGAGGALPSVQLAGWGTLPNVSPSAPSGEFSALNGSNPMGISAGVGTLIGGGLGAIGNIFGASEQAGATEQAAQLQQQTAEQALALQKQMFETEQGNLAPYRTAALNALGELSSLLGVPQTVTAQTEPGNTFSPVQMGQTGSGTYTPAMKAAGMAALASQPPPTTNSFVLSDADKAALAQWAQNQQAAGQAGYPILSPQGGASSGGGTRG